METEFINLADYTFLMLLHTCPIGWLGNYGQLSSVLCLAQLIFVDSNVIYNLHVSHLHRKIYQLIYI